MEKDDATVLNYCYVIAIVVFGLIYYYAIESAGIHFGFSDQFEKWFKPMNMVVSAALGLLTVFMNKSKNENHEKYLSSISELRKVTFPSFDATKQMTWVVCVVVGIFAAILAMFDLAWVWVLSFII